MPLSTAPSRYLTVPTRATRVVLSALDENLTARPLIEGAARAGEIIGVTGALGAGKTHVAAAIQERCAELARRTGRLVRPVYLDLTTVSPESMYAAFVNDLGKDEVTTCVQGYHTELVGRQIDDREVAARAMDVLRSPDLSPRDRERYLDRFGLSGTLLHEKLRERLRTTVGSADYAAAFSFLLRDGLDQAAWSWLRGEEPAGTLQERGLESAAGADVDGAGMAYFARLYGPRDFRLVLIVDNVDEVATDTGRQTLRKALGTTISHMRSAGAVVFLLSTVDTLSRLRLSRLVLPGRMIEMTGFDGSDIREFLELGSVDGTLAPFDESAIDALHDITGGNPAQLGDLSARLRVVADRTGRTVTAGVVRDEARRSDRTRITAAARRVFDQAHWNFHTQWRINSDVDGPSVDFWLPMNGTAGCAVVIADALVDRTTVDRLADVVHALDIAATRSVTLLVVAGAIDARFTDRVHELTGREPLPYVADSFEDDLAAAVKAVRHSLDADDVGGELSGVQDRISQLSRQLGRQESSTLEQLGSLRTTVEELRDEIRRGRGGTGRQPVGGTDRGVRGVPARRPDPTLPDATLRAFVVTQLALEGLDPTVGLGPDLFASDDRAVRSLRRAHAADGGALAALGTLRLAVTGVAAFRTAVEDAVGRQDGEEHPGLGGAALREVERLCDRFDEIVRMLQLGGLDDLHRIRRPSAPSTGSGDWTEHLDGARQLLRELSRQVVDTLASGENPGGGLR